MAPSCVKVKPFVAASDLSNPEVQDQPDAQDEEQAADINAWDAMEAVDEDFPGNETAPEEVVEDAAGDLPEELAPTEDLATETTDGDAHDPGVEEEPAPDLPAEGEDQPDQAIDAALEDEGNDPGILDPPVDPFIELDESTAPDDAIAPCAVPPFDPLCPCEKDYDCKGGACTENPDGKVCGPPCGTAGATCPAGWSCVVKSGTPPQAACRFPEFLCRPCRTDADCNEPGGPPLASGPANRCIDEGWERRSCGTACGQNLGCPDGYACTQVNLGVEDASQCRPIGGGKCPCTEWFAVQAYPTACAKANQWGTCKAETSCDKPCPASVPASETANGKDDDCDGKTDEGLPLLVSDFETGGDGWWSGSEVSDTEWAASGGNPGGYVFIEAGPGYEDWFWQSPTKFSGNLSAAYGGRLAFDRKPGKPSPLGNYFDVEIWGTKGGMIITAGMGSTGIDGWTSLSVDLKPEAGWIDMSNGYGTATKETILSVLGDVQGIYIQGTSGETTGIGALDNVILYGPQ